MGYRFFDLKFGLNHTMSADPRCNRCVRRRWAAWWEALLQLIKWVWAEHLFSLECARRPLFHLGYKRGWVLGRSDTPLDYDRGGHAVRAYTNITVCGSLFG